MTGNSGSNTNLKSLGRLSVLLMTVPVCLPLFAQQTGISGRVSDPSSAMVASVAVSATAEDGTKVSTITNATGLYQFPGIRAGDYRLRFEGPGFAPAERTISVLVGQMATV